MPGIKSQKLLLQGRALLILTAGVFLVSSCSSEFLNRSFSIVRIGLSSLTAARGYSKQAPFSGIESIELTITAPDLETITESYPSDTTSIAVEVPPGQAREFEIVVNIASGDPGFYSSFRGTGIADLVVGETKTLPIDIRPWTASKITFVADGNESPDIFVMNTDGTGRTNLAPHAAFEDSCLISPGGTRIAFNSSRAGLDNVFVMDIDGSNVTQLTGDPTATVDASVPVSWSPDGSQIGFVTDQNGNYELYSMDADGTNLTRLTNDSSLDYGPFWSPDGTRIAFITNRDGNFEIYAMNADGSSPQNLTNNPAEDGIQVMQEMMGLLDWSPDGTKIAFTTNRDGDEEIYVMDSTGANQTNLTNNSAIDEKPVWSPDGSQLLFVTYRDFNSEIYVMNADGSAQTNITNTVNDNESYPSW